MAINKLTEQKILAAARVADVLRDSGVELSRRGGSLVGLCPFHNDRTIGSFAVHERKNFYKCFACGASGDAVKAVRELHGLKYTDALRYLAAMYNIYIDDEPRPQVKRHEPRPPLPPLIFAYWNIDILKPYLHHTEDNNLLKWMLNLPMRDGHKANLRNMIELYMVGTSLKGATAGWVMWPQVDEQLRVRDIKLMAYKDDGHRNKDIRYSTNWMRSLLSRAGKFDDTKYEVHHCLFGLHLAAWFPDAEVCLVESEKTAVICSAFSDPKKRIWMAVGGLQSFNLEMLKPLIDANRYIVLYPDVDGAAKWREIMEVMDYPKMSISAKMRPIDQGGLYNPTLDSPKADIADIMIRMMQGIEETPAEIAARRLCAPEKVKDIAALMDKLDLTLND